MLSPGFARRTGRSIRLVRTLIEVTVLAAGWLLGGTVGIGTVLFALTIGPLAQIFLRVFAHGQVRDDDRQPSSSSRARYVANRSIAVSNSG